MERARGVRTSRRAVLRGVQYFAARGTSRPAVLRGPRYCAARGTARRAALRGVRQFAGRHCGPARGSQRRREPAMADDPGAAAGTVQAAGTARPVGDIELPFFDYDEPGVRGEVFHQRLAGLREQSWLARSSLAHVVLDRESGEFFLRSKQTRFPGREIA